MNPLQPSQTFTGMTEAQTFFQNEKLNMPFIPQDEKSRIVAYQEGVYGSKINPMSVYDIETYIKDALSKPLDDFVIFGYAGHGIASRAMHYYAVKGNLALFIQLGYGAASNERRDRIDGIFHTIGYLFKSVQSAKEASLIPEDRRLLIVESDFYGRGWGWIESYPGEIEKSQWHTEEPILLNAWADIPNSRFLLH